MSRRAAPSTQVIAVLGLSIALLIVLGVLVLEVRNFGPELQQVVTPTVEEDVGR